MFHRILSGMAAGACIALASYAALIAAEITSGGRLAAAVVFPVGLILVLMGKFDLFTGRCMTLVDGASAYPALVLSWITNFAGALVVACLLFPYPEIFKTTAQAKMALALPHAFALGVACNQLVCGAVVLWQKYGVVGAYVPVFLFVLCGFEHSVADMFYLSAGATEDVTSIMQTLLVVTCGNAAGGWVVGMWHKKGDI